MSSIPINCLRKETRDLISALLNPRKIITNEKGQSRDWYGLAELCGIGGEKIPNIERSNDPTNKVLELWSEKSCEESTTANLISYLEILDRFDVIDDATQLIEKDEEYYKQHPEGFTVPRTEIDDKDIITFDDYERKTAGLPPQTYDAFVLFDDDDIGFATDIIQTLEGQYSLKLCVKDRDVLGGESNYDSVIRLISTRCNRVIVVVSPSFFGSPSNKYYYTLAQMDGIEREQRKIIPCIYRDYQDMPLQLKAYHVLNYSRLESAFGNFWDQLYKSIKVAIRPCANILAEPSIVLPKKITQPTKVTNHVKFVSEQPAQVEIKSLPPPEIPISSPSCPSTREEPKPIGKEIKEKKSLLKKIENFLPKTKRIRKANKLKIAVAN